MSEPASPTSSARRKDTGEPASPTSGARREDARRLLAVALVLAACGHEGKNLSGETRVAPPGGQPSAAQSEPAANPHAANPHAGMAPPPTSATQSPVAWTAPTGWKESPPSSAMRAAQFDVGDGSQCVVYVGIGGDDESNLRRWGEQMGAAEGDAKIAQTDHDGLKITRFEASGSYTDTMRPGAEAKTIAAATMLAAIVESPSGKLHVKLVGPSSVVDANAEKFDAFLASMKTR